MARRKNILKRWDITIAELTAAIDDNPSLCGMLHGYVAKQHLRKMWFTNWSSGCVRKDDNSESNYQCETGS